jgi:hypothetical protein
MLRAVSAADILTAIFTAGRRRVRDVRESKEREREERERREEKAGGT